MARSSGLTGLSQVLLWLAIIGALNWGLVGFFDFDLVRTIFGGDRSTDASGFARVIYALVGLAGVGLLFLGPRLRDTSATHVGGRAEVRA